jgi:PHD/YefM family antitoxin component YafN of YafNO toxin-antitoxin module
MITRREQYIVDEQGKRTGVILDVEIYEQMLEELEELEELRAYDAAKASDDEVIPFGQAIREIEHQRGDL